MEQGPYKRAPQYGYFRGSSIAPAIGLAEAFGRGNDAVPTAWKGISLPEDCAKLGTISTRLSEPLIHA